MGEVVSLAHARESTGRGTCNGHSASAGQDSENQPITSSYFRAVKVFSPSSKRSKKRQSPAAKRPTVARLIDRAATYAEAQAMRFERSSDSIAAKHSRKIPTTQGLSVGKFRLAELPVKSDKSAMPTVDQVRQIIRHALEKAGEGPVAIAIELGDELEIERNYVRDFLEGKKDSMKMEVMFALSERYNISIHDLQIKRRKKKKMHSAA